MQWLLFMAAFLLQVGFRYFGENEGGSEYV